MSFEEDCLKKSLSETGQVLAGDIQRRVGVAGILRLASGGKAGLCLGIERQGAQITRSQSGQHPPIKTIALSCRVIGIGWNYLIRSEGGYFPSEKIPAPTMRSSSAICEYPNFRRTR